MTDPVDHEALARSYLDLVDKVLSDRLADPAWLDLVNGLVARSWPGARAYVPGGWPGDGTAPRAGAAENVDAAVQHERSRADDAPPRATPAGDASVDRLPELDHLQKRLDALEKRLDTLESPPRGRRRPA